MSETSGELGGALGIAILGSLSVAVYRSGVSNALPEGVSPEVADAALDTLGGALAIAQSLPAAIGAALVEVAQTAFVDAIHVVAAVSAVLAVVTAIGAFTALRGVQARSESPESEGPAPAPAAAVD
jgi:DHA2 family multidrug resistance protein-like MFS transporter